MRKFGEILGIVLAAILLLLLIYTFQFIVAARIDIGNLLSVFSTIFLGIFIEAAPFLLLGTLASGFVEVYISKERIRNNIPKNPWLGALAAGMMGFVFPVCECGVVPLTRRLFKKGVPPNVGITFLLASPVINPIVIASTYSAFGWGPVLWIRVGLSLLIAVAVGAIFYFQRTPWKILNPTSMSLPQHDQPIDKKPTKKLFWSALQISAEEFYEMGRYLILGSILAALMQTLVPQSKLLALGAGSFSSILILILLAIVLSICSTVDAFIALSFVGTFTTGSILSFLVFGPMVDIKSTMMYLQVFRRKTVVYLIVLPLLMTILAAVFMNYYTG
jgi:uncharacterized membrane protein YraQ (UPF0718 family)